MSKPHTHEKTMETKELHPAVRKYLRGIQSKGGKVGAGTPERKARARHAANVRWGNVPKPSTITTNP